MMTRPIAVAALAGTIFAGGTLQEPDSTKYQIDLNVTTVADLTELGGPEQTQTRGITGFVTIALSDTTGGQALLATIDSVVADTGMGLEAAMLDSARGVTFTGLVSPNGRITNLETSSENVAAAQFKGILSDFFPLMEEGAEPGDTWSDTSNTTEQTDDGTTTSSQITNYSVTGTETRNGTEALKVETAFAFTQTAEVNGPQGSFNMDGGGSGRGTYFVSQDGLYLGGTAERAADMTVLGAAPMPIPLKVNSTLVVTKLP